MAANGVHVKELDTLPKLYEVEEFYLEVYNVCGDSPKEIISYCKLLGLSRSDIIETIQIIRLCQ